MFKMYRKHVRKSTEQYLVTSLFGRSTLCFVYSTGKSSQVRGGGRLGHWLPIDSTGDGWVRFCGFRRGVSDYP